MFDLSVEPHRCYLANGVLVSNSDAFQTMAVGMRRAMGFVTDSAAEATDEDEAFGGLSQSDGRAVLTPYELDSEVF